MPITISDFATEEKNKLGSSNTWLQFMKISYPTSSGWNYVRVVKNSEGVDWGGHFWSPVYFELDELGDHTTGEVPQVTVKFSNTDLFFQAVLTEYDTYCKNNGVVSLNCWYYIANSGNLNDPDPEVEYEFILKEPTADAEVASFTLGAASMYSKKFPANKVLKNHCRFSYQDDCCKAPEAYTVSLSNNVTEEVIGNYDYQCAIDLDGEGACLHAEDKSAELPGTSKATYEILFKRRSDVEGNEVDSYHGCGAHNVLGSGTHCEIGTYGSNIEFYLYNDGRQRTSFPGSVQNNTLHHLAFTIDDGLVRVYLDSVFEGSNYWGSMDTAPALEKIGDTLVNSYPSFSSIRAPFDGKIFDFRIWGYARTQAQIQNDKDKRLTGNEYGLIAYYTMNSGSGNVIDRAGTNDLELKKGAFWTKRTYKLNNAPSSITNVEVDGVSTSDYTVEDDEIIFDVFPKSGSQITVTYDTEDAGSAFIFGEDIVGNSSGESAVVCYGEGNLISVKNRTGKFMDNEVVVGQTSGATGVVFDSVQPLIETCNKTLSDCRTRGNSQRFGGFPSVGYKGLRFDL